MEEMTSLTAPLMFFMEIIKTRALYFSENENIKFTQSEKRMFL
jgi:hypothetical protein